MDRRIFNRAGLLAGFSALFADAARAQTNKGKGNDEGKSNDKGTHRVAIQIDSSERKAQEQALGNAHNYAAHYKAKGAPFQIEVVVFGPGYGMVRDDISMVAGNIEALQKDLGDRIAFSACQNTRAAIAASTGQTPDKVPQMKSVKDTPSGVVRLAELQEQGWSYLRP